MESLNLQLVAVLMKHHTVPHLKALARSIEHASRYGRGSTFMQFYIVLKSSILLHKRAHRILRLILQGAPNVFATFHTIQG